MAGRSAKIGITLIVFGILWLPSWWIIQYKIREFTGWDLDYPFDVGMFCVPAFLLPILGLVKFLMDDD